jgi:hypothetical protein
VNTVYSTSSAQLVLIVKTLHAKRFSNLKAKHATRTTNALENSFVISPKGQNLSGVPGYSTSLLTSILQTLMLSDF